jgi:hypothetical protein
MTLSSATMATMALFLSTVYAHVVMNTPNGFPNLRVQSSPLGQGIAFPCQFGPSASQYDFSNSTKVAAGDKTLLSFIGSAVHGGGSCQVSVSKTASANPKDWKVIQSMIGGCPATITVSDGNLDTINTVNGYPDGQHCASPDSTETDCVKSYMIQVPKGVPSGQYFFSWSWFNKVGNREMYMNCAPVEVTSGGSDASYLDSLPSMFMANVNGQPCTTFDNGPAQGVLDIPNPGNNVVRSTNPKDATGSPVLGTCAALYGGDQAVNAPAGGSGSGVSPDAGSSATAPASSSGASPSAGFGSSSTVSGSASAAETLSQSATTPALEVASITATSYIATTTVSILSATITSDAASSTTLGPSSISALASASISAPSSVDCQYPCPTDGVIVCLPPDQFGLCDHGCVVPRLLSVGTTCSNGVVSKRAGISDATKRHVRDVQGRKWIG